MSSHWPDVHTAHMHYEQCVAYLPSIQSAHMHYEQCAYLPSIQSAHMHYEQCAYLPSNSIHTAHMHMSSVHTCLAVCIFAWRTELNAAQPIMYSQDDLNKRINRRTETWQNGCFRKINDHPGHATPNHHPPKMDVLPKTFHQIILATN